MPKPLNPYDRLKSVCREWMRQIIEPEKRLMWTYPLGEMQKGKTWNWLELWAKVGAAHDLGYDVMLEAKETGLMVRYVKQAPGPPWELRS